MARTPHHRSGIVLVAMAMLVGLLTVPAAAADAADAALERMSFLRAAGADGAGRAYSQTPAPRSGQCFTDPVGDTVNEQTRVQESFPRADLIEFCEAYTEQLTVSALVLEPTNPSTDPNWNWATFIGWFVDTNGDGLGDFYIDFSLDVDGALAARVLDIRDENNVVVACAATPSFAGGAYMVGGIGRSCIGSPPSLRTSPGTSYDVNGPDGPRYTDAAPFQMNMPPATFGAPRDIGRLAGPGRIQTAVEISKYRFPGTSRLVFLARADLFADAVAGGSLTDGPILLVPSCGTIPDVVRNEIQRLNPIQIFALGGQSAICEAMLDQAAAGRTKGRIGGTGRVQTSLRISQHQFPQPIPAGDVYLARADVFADAVAGGHLTRGPIILVPRCGAAPQDVRSEIDRLNPARVVALGGSQAICDELLTELAFGRRRDRLAGIGRIQTAVEISKDEWPGGAKEVYLARADLFADAVAAGSLSGGPILLVPSCGALPDAVRVEIRRVNPARVIALGGTAAICDALLQAAAATV
jgi:putative cell wall-binding protein